MHKRDDEKPHGGAHDPSMAVSSSGGRPGGGPTHLSNDNQLEYYPQLAPDKVYKFEYSVDEINWDLFAFVDVTTTIENWFVNRVKMAEVTTKPHVRITVVTGVGTIDNSLPEFAYTNVAWTPAALPLASPGAYPTPPSGSSGRTFAAAYGRTQNPLAIYFQTSPTSGGAKLELTHWYNPEATAIPSPVTIATDITLHHTSSASYPGICRNAPSSLSLTPLP
jgi:hypothetical protein